MKGPLNYIPCPLPTQQPAEVSQTQMPQNIYARMNSDHSELASALSGHPDHMGPSTSDYELPQHPFEFRQDLPPPYRCHLCSKTFSVPARLLRHNRIHTGEKPFKCDYCDKTFSVKENLNVHRRIHTKERPYKCNLCDKKFEHSGKLHRHMRTHTGERPHKCEICQKTFVQSGQLVIHMRAHTGEKPYTCDYCQKGFTCSKQLKVHIRTHTGEKPYECDVCGKTFGYNHVLKMHKMSHLGEKLYKCTLCDRFFGSRKSLDSHIKEHNKDSLTNPLNSTASDPPPLIYDDSTTSGTASLLRSSSPGPRFIQNCENDSNLSDLNSDRNNEFNETGRSSFQHRISLSPAASHHSSIQSGFKASPDSTPLTPPLSPDERYKGSSPVDLNGFNMHSPCDEKIITSINQNRCHANTGFGDIFQAPQSMSSTISSDYIDSMKHVIKDTGELQSPHLIYFTTVTGQRFACPADLLVRLDGGDEKKQQLQKEFEERLRVEEQRRRSEKIFRETVVEVLESCIGQERLQRLGYPKITIDEVIRNTLNLMGSQPCWEPSISEMDRIKVNMRLLLKCCVPDEELWLKFGWKGKAIEDIINEFIEKC